MNNLMKYAYISIITIFVATTTGCSTHAITTNNDRYADLYLADSEKTMSLVMSALSGMKGYTVLESNRYFIKIKYDPGGVLSGSATIDVSTLSATGRSRNNEMIKGTELVFTNKTAWYSDDPSFNGGNIIGIVEKQVRKAADFQGIGVVVVEKE